MNFDEENWLAFRQANLKFAEVVRSQLKSGDMVWVQDYHLMLLPMLLRNIIENLDKKGNLTRRELNRITEGMEAELEVPHSDTLTEVKIGFFLHTPFPSSEIYR